MTKSDNNESTLKGKCCLSITCHFEGFVCNQYPHDAIVCFLYVAILLPNKIYS